MFTPIRHMGIQVSMEFRSMVKMNAVGKFMEHKIGKIRIVKPGAT